jgi:hypothetical protein
MRGVEVFVHPLDRTALASGVAAFEDHGDALAGVADPGVELHQLDLERRKLVLVVVFVHPGVVGIGGIEDGVLLRRADGLAHAFGASSVKNRVMAPSKGRGTEADFEADFDMGFKRRGRLSCSCYGA